MSTQQQQKKMKEKETMDNYYRNNTNQKKNMEIVEHLIITTRAHNTYRWHTATDVHCKNVYTLYSQERNNHDVVWYGIENTILVIITSDKWNGW